jgi:hypothetical protein
MILRITLRTADSDLGQIPPAWSMPVIVSHVVDPRWTVLQLRLVSYTGYAFIGGRL